MEDLIFHNIRNTPFSIHGLYQPHQDGPFRRIPQDIAKQCKPRVEEDLYLNTAGGRVRFCTDADTITVRVYRQPFERNYRLSPYLEFGVDVYMDTLLGSKFLASSRLYHPENAGENVWERTFCMPAGKKELTVYMPCYGKVENMEIGIPETAMLASPRPYTFGKPILFYGSSITQGACASRSGKAYPAILSRRFDFDFINLGFAGSCHGEAGLCDHMATLEMGAFVCDYDHNRSSADRLASNHFQVYERIRQKHPDIPYYMISRPDFCYNEMDFDRRAVIMESYLRAWRGGDRNVYFIDGSTFFCNADKLEFTQDGCHPTDEGFERMASLIGTTLENTLPFETLKN